MRYLVCTLNLFHDRLHPTIRDSQAAAARRWNADYIAFRQSKGYGKRQPGADRLLLDEHCKDFNRVLFLDRGSLVRSDCPNLFNLVPPGTIGAVPDLSWRWENPPRRREAMTRCCRLADLKLDLPTEYLNSDTLLFEPSAHHPVFALARQLAAAILLHDRLVSHHELLSLAIMQTGTPVTHLSCHFNRADWSGSPFVSAAMPPYVAHWQRDVLERRGSPAAPIWDMSPRYPRPRVVIDPIALPTPEAFNGAALAIDRRRLFVYRRDKNQLAYCWLDGDRADVDRPHGALPLSDHGDPRLFQHNGKMYLQSTTPGGLHWSTHLELRELHVSTDLRLTLQQPVRFVWVSKCPGYIQHVEKNWAPFSVGNDLYYVYSFTPHRILRVDSQLQEPHQCAASYWAPSSSWDPSLGRRFRLNAPPIRLRDGTYLSTFHTVQPGTGAYFTGFYTFEGTLPFRVLRMSPRPVLTPKHSSGQNVLNRRRQGCVFPLSLEVDECSDTVTLFAGDNDHRCIRITIPLSGMLAHLM